jgi:hypothetical protein
MTTASSSVTSFSSFESFLDQSPIGAEFRAALKTGDVAIVPRTEGLNTVTLAQDLPSLMASPKGQSLGSVMAGQAVEPAPATPAVPSPSRPRPHR